MKTIIYMANGMEVINCSPEELSTLITNSAPSPWIFVETDRLGPIVLNSYMIVSYHAKEE